MHELRRLSDTTRARATRPPGLRRADAEARRSQEDLLHDPEQLAQFQFKNTMLLADMNRSLAGHAPTAVGAALPSASLLEDQVRARTRPKPSCVCFGVAHAERRRTVGADA